MMSESLMLDRRIEAIAIGGSAGALLGLKRLLPCATKATWPPTLVVMHVREGRPAAIAQVLSRLCQIAVKEAEDKEPLEPGTIYVAPPGYHMLVADDKSIALSIDAPVHFSRPAIDVLFESAADTFGKDLLALLLSGASRDGASGLQHVRQCGGLALVQDPAEATHATMPSAAIALAQPHVLTLSQLVLLFDTVAQRATDGVFRRLV